MFSLQCNVCYQPGTVWDIPYDDELWVACDQHSTMLRSITSATGQWYEFTWKRFGVWDWH